MYNHIREIIQVALGIRQKLTRALSEAEWEAVCEESVRQAIAGICFAGIEKLPKEQMPPQMLLLQWIGLSEQIKQKNSHMDNQTAIIWKKLKEDGLQSAILKGQGIAQEYGILAPFRQPGDIDIWVKGGYQMVCDYIQRTIPTQDLAYHRFHYNFFKDTEVEIHHRPTLMRNLLDDRKLAKWYNSFGADSFRYLEDKGFAVPSREFNRIFILTHIYRHFLFEGIGLRQVMDYYFVLKNSEPGLEELRHVKDFRMMRFAGAMMWILHTQFGLPTQKLICEPNETEGRFVLSEIMATGNFGYGDKRYRYKSFVKLRRQMAHGAHLLMHYPSEVMWTPIWLIYHKVWKWNKKRKIKMK